MDSTLYEEIGLYIENRIRPDRKMIAWNKYNNKFVIFAGDTSIVEESLTAPEFFVKYRQYIKDSKYYTSYMALILGSHAED